MIYGAQEVLKITPAATLFAFMVGVTLGLPAGYFGGGSTPRSPSSPTSRWPSR
jgi:ABC-type dipeptide/oligopeptide/nickel transport system permease subunit